MTCDVKHSRVECGWIHVYHGPTCALYIDVMLNTWLIIFTLTDGRGKTNDGDEWFSPTLHVHEVCKKQNQCEHFRALSSATTCVSRSKVLILVKGMLQWIQIKQLILPSFISDICIEHQQNVFCLFPTYLTCGISHAPPFVDYYHPLPSTLRREFKHIVGKKSLVPNYTCLGTRPHSAHVSICTQPGGPTAQVTDMTSRLCK